MACASEDEPPPVRRTRWVSPNRDVRTSSQYLLHSQHVLYGQWDLELCEYCLVEYYLVLPPLGMGSGAPPPGWRDT
jgi:hypothetical protein